ncbi:MAG: thiosulfate oxidation carrier complex protein SoxZ [Gammaproteobacteria bacterium]|jgi:sulfur-oxidizing protein SoxZ|nr:thiosulfate oxidation carrier complex protein SoxZ [Gammaproteobacteria bacterium]
MASIKMRANIADGVTTIKALISHPMDTGLVKDKKTGEVIPAHYIQEVVCKHKGNTVLTANWGPAVSKNPYLSFKFSGAAAGDTVSLSWVDNKGEKDSSDVTIK